MRSTATPHFALACAAAVMMASAACAAAPAGNRAMDDAPTPPAPTGDGTAALPPLEELLPSIKCERAWIKPEGPIMVTVTRPPNMPPLDLVLMSRTGTVLASAPIDAGRYDALAMLPAIHGLEKAAWLQLLSGGHPVGQPLVVTPLRTPPPCRTAESMRPDGRTRYTRIVGWGELPLDPTDPETQSTQPKWIAGDSVITSGFRVHPDRDAIMHTEFGEIRFAFAPDAAPATASNFIMLAEAGFYDGTVIHRVVPRDREGRPFVIQGGDPTTTGDGGPGYNLALEPSDLPHDFGVLSMARGDEPHSAGSQFFVALSREGTARLDGQYCAFGYAVNGRDAILRMADVPIADPRTGRPKEPPKVLRVELVPAPARVPGTDRRDLRLSREPPAPPPGQNPER